MILPDHEIAALNESKTLISPFNMDQLQPASYDLRLGPKFRRFDPETQTEPIDPASGTPRTKLITVKDPHGSVTLPPKRFCLATTVERIAIPNDLVARVEGKSSLARLGLFVHVTAGFIDPGFEGFITLELFNANHESIILYPNMKICQISFEQMSSPAEKPYGHASLGSKYAQQDSEPVESAYWMNFLIS